MSNIFRVRINQVNKDEHHEAHFTDLPTRGDVIDSLKEDRGLADSSYNEFYDYMVKVVEHSIEWPEYFGYNQADTGFPLYGNGKKIPGKHTHYIRFSRLKVFSNDPDKS